MKIQNILGALLLMMVSQCVLATKFKVVNLSSYGYMEIDPVWTGNPRGWSELLYGMDYGRYFNSAHHHLKNIQLRIAGKGCLIANFEKDNLLGNFKDRFKDNVIIRLYDNYYTIDLSEGAEESMQTYYEKGNC